MDRKEVSFKDQLTAVVIADNFDARTVPIDTTWGCLTIGNACLLDYTFESLSRTPVKNVILTATRPNHVNHIVDIWRGCFDWIKVIDVGTATSVGDVMRTLDTRAELQGDWLLVHAGLICTDTLNEAIQLYKGRRKKDKNCVMTLVYSERKSDDNEFGIACTETGKLTNYKMITGKRDYRNIQQIKPPLLTELTDCQIAICSPQIPPLFTDNFDFKSRADVIREMLANEDILGNLIHVYTLPPNKFATCIRTYNDILTVSSSLLTRWTYPCTPDSLTFTSTSSESDPTGCDFTHDQRFIYLPQLKCGNEPNKIARVDKSSRLIRAVLISPGCTIGERCNLENVLLEPNVTIGAGCTLQNCIIAASVTIADGCVIHDSIILQGCTIGAQTQIGPRCVLANKTEVAAKSQLSETVLSSRIPEGDTDPCTALPYQPGSFRWSYHLRTDRLWPPCQSMRQRFADADGVVQDDSEDSSDDDDMPDTALQNAVANGDAADDSFTAEVFETIQRALRDEKTAKNLLLELNGAKFAYNATNVLLITAIIRSVVVLAQKQAVESKQSVHAAVAQMFGKMAAVMAKYFESEESQSNGLAALEELAMDSNEVADSLVHIVHFMYDKDLLSELTIRRWYDELEDEEADKIKPNVSPFIKWLQEAEEESESEEDSD